MDSLNNSDITLADIALMQHLFGCLRSSSGTEALPSHHATPLTSAPPPSQPPPSQISLNQTVQQSNQGLLATQSSVDLLITGAYLNTAISQALPHDIHHATSPHPSHPAPFAARAVSASQPFLGFNELSVGMTGQANQRQLASAAHLPRPPRLINCGNRSNCGMHHGHAVHPPSLPCGPALEDCMYVEPDTNVPMVHIKAYIYPPKPHHNSRVSCTN